MSTATQPRDAAPAPSPNEPRKPWRAPEIEDAGVGTGTRGGFIALIPETQAGTSTS